MFSDLVLSLVDPCSPGRQVGKHKVGKHTRSAIGNTIGNTMGNSIGNYIKHGLLKRWHFELNIKEHNLIKGCPGLLNTIGTLLDRSRTKLHLFQKN